MAQETAKQADRSVSAIAGTTRLLGVMGDPVAHSLSPVMHNRAIAALGVDCVYVPLPVAAANLAAAIAGLGAIGALGFNVTIPHKQAIAPLLADLTPEARAVGAVNTVWRDGDRWCGTNTDVAGFLAPLQALAPPGGDWAGATAIVLGSGGAARAAIAGCRQLGVGRIRVAGRNGDRLAALAAQFQPPNPLAVSLETGDWDALAGWASETALLVNATPVGMHPQVAAAPVAPDILAALPSGAIAYDLIYTPRPTRFLQAAAAAGLTAIDGTEMLVQQGAAALSLWLGQPAPADLMRSALLAALARSGR